MKIYVTVELDVTEIPPNATNTEESAFEWAASTLMQGIVNGNQVKVTSVTKDMLS